MSVVSPPRPPAVEEPPDPEALEALIEEARRRARRRRQGYALAALFAGALGAGAFFGFRDGASGAGDVGQREPIVRAQPVIARRATRNGPLAIMTAAPRSRGWYGLSTIGADGRLRRLVRCPAHVSWCGEVESLEWSSDGRWLALSVDSVANPNPYNGIHVVNLGTGEDRHISPERVDEGGWFDLAWAPDGSRLAYVRGRTIFLLTFSPVVTGAMEANVLETGSAGHDSAPSWSPDSRWIAYDSRGRGRSAIYVIAAAGGQKRLLVRHGSDPAWSPDGKTIAYRRGCAIRMITPDGADVTPFALSRCLFGPMGSKVILGQPVWSPDGRKLAVAVPWRTGQERWRGTWVVNADGGGLRRLTREARGVAMGQEPRAAWRPLPSGRG